MLCLNCGLPCFVTDNAHDAGATELKIEYEELNDPVVRTLKFLDNGKGMSAKELYDMLR